MTSPNLELLAGDYGRAVEARRALTGALRQAVLACAEQYAGDLRACAAAEADAHAALLAEVEARPDLFEKPKTRTISGVKFGWQQGKPSIHVEDEAETLKRIRKLLPPEQVELLIRTKEYLHKPSVLDLSMADLRRLKIDQVQPEPAPFAKPVSDGVDRLVALMLTEADNQNDEGFK